MKKIAIGLLMFLVTTGHAQEKRPNDTIAVHSIDGIVEAVLRTISGEAGTPNDLEAFRDLFLPSARLTVLTHQPSTPYRIFTVDEFIHLIASQPDDRGFIEVELEKVTDEYNGIAQVFQSYHAKDDKQHDEKGINSYQLVYFNNRWWIANIIWTGDSNGVTVPEKYLEK